ncbi:hypothetical protein [Paenibacillus crassostreae]|uniref:Uncharacterized protein n=1 Tax=Paenibacillus crassostreae TaxID=1763538 RepID=A0A167GBT8_9BACL|nr:hypothetical protein [Paenibacillus crassostreae]AOZ92655.1 hypothetical protein LPB68_10775 [Paenibacillus crassostreae]OAB77424.1 hypothetical protein PNBC_01770 [Paenibacillus crassostreae]
MLKWNKKNKCYLLLVLCCFLSMSFGGTLVQAESDSDSYNYSYWGNTVGSPAPYQATALMDGNSLNVGIFNEPSDLHVTLDHHIYVLDSGNSRVVILDDQYKVLDIIDSFLKDGQQEIFSKPQGIFVTEDKHIYIADTGNKRVVHLNQNFELMKVVESPQSELLQENFEFLPVRIVVDNAKRIYVMATGVFDGFMEFNADGEFTTFIGANRVTIDPIEYLWKTLSTKEQRSQMVQFTPMEFTNLDINDEGFIYATNGQENDNIKKLNAQGNNILREEGYFLPSGDISYSSDVGPSRMIDIDVTNSEIYSALDSKRGRIFTYNGDGHLMYVFGGLGNQLGEFVAPVAIARVGDDFLVLDKALGEITIFRTTAYGRTLNEAVRSYYRGDEEAAYKLYNETINMNANLEFAYSGIGKSLIRQGDYDGAMTYFKESIDQKGYSKAFLLHRKEVLRGYFPIIMTCIVLLVFITFIWSKVRKTKGGRKIVNME